MFDCSFSAPSLSLSSICDAALNVSIALDHYKNMYADDPTSFLPCLTPYYLLRKKETQWFEMNKQIYSRVARTGRKETGTSTV